MNVHTIVCARNLANTRGRLEAQNMKIETLEAELLRLARQLDPDFKEEWIPYLMLDLLEDGVFENKEKDQT